MNKIKYFKKEISYIKDESKRKDIEVLVDLLPEYFFSIPMGEDGDCPKYGVSKNGLVKYTKVAVRIAIDMFNTVNNLSDSDKDLIIMAILLHDGMRNGIVNNNDILDEHPLLMSELIMKNASKLEMDIDDVRKMCTMIESHTGNDSKYDKVDLPVPVNEIQRYVYRCCYLASRKYLNVRFNKLDIIC